MTPTFAYIYTMRDQAERVRATAASHAAYWKDLGLPGYLGGPFADRSGGLIVFEAEDEEQARRLVEADPFVVTDLLAHRRVSDWRPE